MQVLDQHSTRSKLSRKVFHTVNFMSSESLDNGFLELARTCCLQIIDSPNLPLTPALQVGLCRDILDLVTDLVN